MGLDMYLKAKMYAGNWDFSPASEKAIYLRTMNSLGIHKSDLNRDAKSLKIEIEVAYWRKVNAVHGWFVNNVSEGVDNCNPVYVTREQLQELVDTCRKVQAAPSMANEFLPAMEGFFFGDSTYDEYYFSSLQDTIEQIERVLNNPKFKDYEFYYEASR